MQWPMTNLKTNKIAVELKKNYQATHKKTLKSIKHKKNKLHIQIPSMSFIFIKNAHSSRQLYFVVR